VFIRIELRKTQAHTMRILVTQTIDDVGMSALQAAGMDVDVWPGPAPIPLDALLSRVSGCAGLMPMLTDRIDAAVMDAGPLSVIANHAVGTDNIDLDAAAARGIVVTNTPGVLTDATADLTMALVLAVGRRLRAADALMRDGGFAGWRPTLLRGIDLSGATLGIVGKGRIGSAVAHRAMAFGMRPIHTSANSGVPLDVLLQTADVVSLHCPLTPDTHHLIDAAALQRMKSTAILINTARGPVIDEAALVEALRDNAIAGAGLDVYEAEPAIHPGLIALDNVVLLPHLGSATWGTRQRMAVLAADNLIAVLTGHPPPNPVLP
jgi:glyoxylate reductase